jgi:hypothetical protein
VSVVGGTIDEKSYPRIVHETAPLRGRVLEPVAARRILHGGVRSPADPEEAKADRRGPEDVREFLESVEVSFGHAGIA